MARRNDILPIVLYVGGGYLAYRIAATGGFGPGIQKLVSGLASTAKGTVVTVLPGASPAPGSPPPPPAAGPGPGGTPSTRPGMDANNFVAPYDYGFVVFVGGQQINGIYSDQGEAERAYNTARGWPN